MNKGYVVEPTVHGYAKLHSVGYSEIQNEAFSGDLMARSDRFLRFLRSPRTAAVLLILLALVCISATLIPQGGTSVAYDDRYGNSVSALIRFFHLDHVFTGWPFLVLMGLFFINLTFCSLYRFIRELRRRGTGRHGPDVLHLGLILLCVGAVISALTGSESPTVWMRPGDVVGLPGGGEFRLVSFDTELYSDGRPRNWISEGVYAAGDGAEQPLVITVNRPARIDGIRIYQDRCRTDTEAGDAGPVEVTGLRIRRRRGMPVVFAAFAAVIVGMVMILLEKGRRL